MKIAVLLCNMGGPDSLESVEPYLFEIFKDPNIIDIPLPGFLRMMFVKFLTRRRAPESREIYRKIGGKSPLLEITKSQAQALQQALNEKGEHQFQVFPAMRYWHPFLQEVWGQVLENDFQKIVVVSMYPFYSTTTTGSIEQEIARLVNTYGTPSGGVLFIDRFGAHPSFVNAVRDQLAQEIGFETVTAETPVHILFSAHSIPMKRILNGDPYFEEVKQALQMIQDSLPEGKAVIHLSFQSKLGPIEWLSPSTSDKIEQLALEGVQKLYVYPLGFVADNSETVYEIDMLYRQLAKSRGIEEFVAFKALNTQPSFISALKQIILERMDASPDLGRPIK